MALSYVEADGEGAPAATAEPVARPVSVAADERGRGRRTEDVVCARRAGDAAKAAAAYRRRSTENRNSNCPMVLGFQGKAQVETLYGHIAEAMLSQPATKIFFKTSEPHASEWISKSIGEIEVERFRESRTRGAFPQQRENEQREITREPLVMASEIGGLSRCTGISSMGIWCCGCGYRISSWTNRQRSSSSGR